MKVDQPSTQPSCRYFAPNRYHDRHQSPFRVKILSFCDLIYGQILPNLNIFNLSSSIDDMRKPWSYNCSVPFFNLDIWGKEHKLSQARHHLRPPPITGNFSFFSRVWEEETITPSPFFRGEGKCCSFSLF